MIEQIEIDRMCLRNNTKPQTKFSYLPYLLRSKSKKATDSFNIDQLSTLDALRLIEQRFESSDIKFIKRLEKSKDSLQCRADLFESVMEFLHLKIVKDDLFYWIPGCRVNNIFTLISELIPDFPRRYKAYYIEKILTEDSALYNCLSFMKERYKTEHEHFEMIKRDLELFECCVTSCFWTDEDPERLENSLGVPQEISISDDLKGMLIPKLSYVEVQLGEKSFKTTVFHLENLYSKSEKSKAYWMEMGIVDEYWNLLI